MGVKIDNFRRKNHIFLSFVQNTDCGCSLEPPQCFRAKIMHIRVMDCNPKFYNMSRVVRKPAFCICENKDADQLRGAFVFTT